MERTSLGHKVFLSYRSADRVVVEEFAQRLRRDGIDAWYDGWEIAPGDDIVARMDKGIDRCGAGLVFVSNAWFGGPWAQDEYTSLAFRKVEDDIRLIPVLVKDVEDLVDRLPTRLRKLARRSVGDYEAIRDTLLGIDRKPGLASALQARTRSVTIRLEATGAGSPPARQPAHPPTTPRHPPHPGEHQPQPPLTRAKTLSNRKSRNTPNVSQPTTPVNAKDPHHTISEYLP